uniref:Uncharacterized protein n=1 Tax=Kalanchoe fedtschenkoi TaxID=63787 RepID=A0A7N0UDQ2_KALFE
MKMVDDPKPHHPEANPFQKLDSATDVDQSKGDSKIFPQDLCDSKCHGNDENDQVQFSVSGVELELPVLREHCKEIDCGAVKDICIDEGVPVTDKIRGEDISEGNGKPMFTRPAKDEELSSDNEKVDVEWPVPAGLKSSTGEACEKDFNTCESKVVAHESEFKSEASGLAPDEDRSSTPENSVEETADEASDMKADTSPAATDKPPFPALVHEKEDVNRPLLSEQQKPASDHFTLEARLQRDHFESSFASLGPHTGSIAYSGPIAYSGSLSRQSDASTVSTRSFAFPVLQNEWNFSPVRMRKADRRRRRGWMNGLLCCKF